MEWLLLLPAACCLLVGHFLEVLEEAGLVGVREIQVVFAGLVFEEPLGADGFGCSLGFFVVEPLCRGTRLVVKEEIQGLSAAFVLADACGGIKVGAGVIG